MAGVRHPQVGPPPLGPETYATKAKRPHQATSCLKPNLLEKHSWLGEVKTHSLQLRWKRKNSSLQKQATPTWSWDQNSSDTHGKCWAPSSRITPAWTPIYVLKASTATPSRITSCLKPNLLKTANAHISVPTAGTQLAWGSQNQQQPALLKSQISRFPEVGSPLLGNWNSLKKSIHIHGKCGAPSSVGHAVQTEPNGSNGRALLTPNC